MTSTTVRMPYERKVHILDQYDEPVCGVEIKPNSVYKDWLFSSDDVCSKCLQGIGSIMIVDYVGTDNFVGNDGGDEK